MLDINNAARIQKSNKPIAVIANRELTYGEQWSRCHTLHNWMQQQGVTKDKPVLLAITNEFEQASLLLALIAIGKPPLIIDPSATKDEASVMLDNSTFDLIISEKLLQQRWDLDKYEVPRLQVNHEAPDKGVFSKLLKKRNTTEDKHSWPACIETNAIPLELSYDQQSLAYVVFTSGTTSAPKGVEITRAALTAQMNTLQKQYELESNCRLLNTLPLHHADGLLQGPLLAWTCGGTVFRPIAFTTQRLQQYMDSIYRDRITHMIAVPTILSLMLRLGQEWGDVFSSDDFRFIISSAGHLERKLWDELEEKFKVPVVNMYGLSETGTSALFNGPDANTRLRGFLGKPVNCEIKIIDEAGQEAGLHTPGELLITGNQLMRGYHNNIDATKEVIRDGWLHTGDMVKLIDSGHIEFVGRKKNQINSGGRNISPEEISTCLNKHPNIMESIVFGQPDPDWEEQVVAIVVSNTQNIDETDVTEWCRTYLSEYKIPKHIMFVDNLEKGPSGKIRINSARELFNKCLESIFDNNAKGTDIESKIIALAAHIFRLHINELNNESNISNTPGWDSLAHMSLIVAMEAAFSIKFSPREIMQIGSIAEAINLCRQKIPA